MRVLRAKNACVVVLYHAQAARFAQKCPMLVDSSPYALMHTRDVRAYVERVKPCVAASSTWGKARNACNARNSLK